MKMLLMGMILVIVMLISTIFAFYFTERKVIGVKAFLPASADWWKILEQDCKASRNSQL